ncbi:MAG: rod shape-determining protein MreC [Salibacteraceae bacterium]
MRNFLQFIWSNQFTFLFFILEILGFAMLTSSNSYQGSQISRTSVAVSGKISEVNKAFNQYIGLIEENEKLIEQNAALKKETSRTHHFALDKNDLINYDVKAAHVLNSTYHLGNNYLIIDRGSLSGIEPQQGVVGTEGVVGIVFKVSDHYSSILPVIHSQNRLSCKLQNSNYFGILKWDGRDDRFAYLEDIPNHVRINDRETIVTRGASGAFPPNQLVGSAVSSERNESSGFQTIKVELATDFKKINNVFILKNEVRQELDTLLLNLEE